MATERTLSRTKATLAYLVIIVITVVVFDVFCMIFGLFPPRPDYGDAVLGWRPARATGAMALGRCVDVSADTIIDYPRNEDGVRTARPKAELIADTATVKIAVVGDSQTELCSSNEALHSGVTESLLRESGIAASALPYGAGKYSPLQAYLAYKDVLKPYGPRVLILNVYTGNDLYDILRVDDRPHFVAAGSGYAVAAPVWYAKDDPTTRHRSRALFAMRLILERMGVRRLYLRVQELRRVAKQQGAGLSTVVAYMRDLYRARNSDVGYPDAFTSQMLNQQLFFHHFAPSRDESLRRVRALLALARAENPGVLVVLSPIPSYQLTGERPIDSTFVHTLSMIPLTYEQGAAQEGALYEELQRLAAEAQVPFVDNLAALRSYAGRERLYNDNDYHLLPPASALIGRAQADVLRAALASPSRAR